MKQVNCIKLHPDREEALPDFDPVFPYIATRAHLDRYPQPSVPWHWHRAVELFYIESGTLEYTTPGGTETFPAGSGGFVNTNVLHTSCRLAPGSNVQLLHLFEPGLLAEQGSRLEQKYILPLTTSSTELIPLYPETQGPLLEKIKAAFALSPEEFGYELRLREALTQIWLELLPLARPRSEGSTDRQIKALLVYIHEHYREPVSVEALADAAHMSRRTCFRLFRQVLHTTPVEYLRNFRLRQACRLLAEGHLPVTEIAYDCGLGSASYFGKLFREVYGCTPSQYRQRWHDPDNLVQK